MRLCKHDSYKIVDWIKSPKWSSNEVLISTAAIHDDTENCLVRFTDPSPQKKYGWFYLSGKDVRSSPVRANGRGFVYAVPLDFREEFEPVLECEHIYK